VRYAALVAMMAVLAAGCKRNRPKVTPAAAAAVAVAAAEPLSVPQTAVRLPPPQPIPPEAIPPEEPGPAPVEAAPVPPRPAAKPRPAPATPPLTPPAPAANTAPANAGPQLRPLFTAEQARQLNRQIDDSLADAQRRLDQARSRGPDRDRAAAIERVRTFVEQAQQARRAGDLNRAKSLAERAAALASDLVKGAR
jgi:hypothetical protein